MIAKLLLSAFIALSMRNPKLVPNKTDFEVTGGLDSKITLLEAKYERESGGYYYGLHVLTKETKIDYSRETVLKLLDGISGEININEATQTNKEYLYKTLYTPKYLPFIFRMTNEWTYWKDYRLMLGCATDIESEKIYINLQYDTNFEDRHTTRIAIATKLIYNKYYVQPKIIYNIYDNEKEWQMKTEVGYIFGGAE